MAPLSRALFGLACSLVLTSALPSGNWDCSQCQRSEWQGRDSTPTVPLSEINDSGASPLLSPTGTLKYIDLGLGFQNYTCGSSKTWVQSTPSAGAIADLYEITNLVNKWSGDSITQNTLKAFEKCLQVTSCEPSTANGFCDSCHRIAAAAFQLNEAGEHFFAPINGAQTPNFDIYAHGDFLSAKKVGDVKAPGSAYDGENGLGAVDWLYLVDNGDGLTHGLKSVYRVETAGGVAPSSCTTPGAQLQVPYAAEYWFYD